MAKPGKIYLGWEILPTPSAEFETWARLPADFGGGNEKLPTPSAIFELKAKSPYAEESGGGEICRIPSGNSKIAWRCNREAVRLHSPGSRSAPWGTGRTSPWHPEGVQLLWHPFGVRNRVDASFPGCAARPWAVELNAFGVRHSCWRHGQRANVFASHYLIGLPVPETLRREIPTTQHALETRAARKGTE